MNTVTTNWFGNAGQDGRLMNKEGYCIRSGQMHDTFGEEKMLGLKIIICL